MSYEVRGPTVSLPQYLRSNPLCQHTSRRPSLQLVPTPPRVLTQRHLSSQSPCGAPILRRVRKSPQTTLWDPNQVATAERRLHTLRQTGSTATYSAKFEEERQYIIWNDPALRNQYYTGLKDDVKDQIVLAGKPDTLPNLKALVIASTPTYTNIGKNKNPPLALPTPVPHPTHRQSPLPGR